MNHFSDNTLFLPSFQEKNLNQMAYSYGRVTFERGNLSCCSLRPLQGGAIQY